MKKIIILSAIGFALTACSNDADEPATASLNDPRAAAFSAQIGETASRAAGTQWAAGDAIGISGMSGTKTYTNVPFTTASGDGNFAPVSDPIFYQTTDEVTFTAYYPYAGRLGADGVITASVADQSNQSEFDFLWAQAVGSYAAPNVRFTFAHRMSRLALTFTNGNDVDLSAMSYSIDGLVLDGSFDTATGEAKALDGAASTTLPIAAMTESAKETASSSLIVFPQTASTIVINATVDGQPYRCNLAVGELKPGYSYNVSISVKKTGMTVSGCTITDWTDGGEFNGNATMPVPARKGDFFYSDGTYSTELNPSKTCIGIVFWTPADVNPDPNALTPASLTDDKIMAADFPNCTHGLVVALKNAGQNVAWTEDETDSYVYRDFQNTDNFTAVNKENYRPVSSNSGNLDEINYILGYQNTQILKAYNEWNEEPSKEVKLVESLENFAVETPAPKNTTDWFIPSPKELSLLTNKDVDDIYRMTGTETMTIIDNKIMLAGGSRFSSYSYMWSSTEYNHVSRYCEAYMLSIFYGYISYDYKFYPSSLRPVLAF